jgi:hypothetical protein
LKGASVRYRHRRIIRASEIVAQTLETQSLAQWKIAEIGRPWEPEDLAFYIVLAFFAKCVVWETMLGLGTTPVLKGDVSIRAGLVISFYLANVVSKTPRGSSSVYGGGTQAMATTRDDHIRAVIAETLAEQQRLQHGNIDAVVLKATVSILTSFGIEYEDRRELHADLQHLRWWRKSVEQAQSYTVRAMITIIVTGFVGAVWLGIKALLGK